MALHIRICLFCQVQAIIITVNFMSFKDTDRECVM